MASAIGGVDPVSRDAAIINGLSDADFIVLTFVTDGLPTVSVPVLSKTSVFVV